MCALPNHEFLHFLTIFIFYLTNLSRTYIIILFPYSFPATGLYVHDMRWRVRHRVYSRLRLIFPKPQRVVVRI